MLVPRIQRDVRDPADLVELIRERLHALRGQDPGFCTDGLPHSFDDGQRLIHYAELHVAPARALLAAISLTLVAVVTLVFTRGAVLAIIAALAIAAFAWWRWRGRAFRRARREWHRAAEPTLGWLVMANDGMFEPGTRDLPGVFLCCDDPVEQRQPQRLARFVSRLWEWIEADDSAVPAAARPVIEWLRAGMEQAQIERIEVPASVCGIEGVTLVSTMLRRADVPGPALDRRLMPMWGRRGVRETVELVPLDLWKDHVGSAIAVMRDPAQEDAPTDDTVMNPPQEDRPPPPSPPRVDAADARAAIDAVVRRMDGVRELHVPAPPSGARVVLALTTALVKAVIWASVPVTLLIVLAAPVAARLLHDGRVPGLGMLSLVATISICIAVWKAFAKAGPAADDEVTIPLERHPELRRLLIATARAVGTRPPDRVVTGWRRGFAVREVGKRGARTRELIFDVGDLVGMSVAETTAILAHEMAHYREGHCEKTERALQRARFPLNLEARLRERGWHRVNPVWWTCRVLNPLVVRQMARVSRRFELQADAVAAQAVGAETFVEALRKTVASGVLVDLRAAHVIEPALAEGVQEPAPDLIGHMAALRPTAEGAEFEQARVQDALDAPAGPFGTHPSVRERIDHVRRLADAGVAPDAPVADAPGLPAMLGDQLESYRRAVSAEILGWNTAWRRREPAIRCGELSAEDLRLADPRMAFRSHRPEVVAAQVIALGVSAVALVAIALFLPHEPREQALMGTAAVVPLALSILLARRFRSGFAADRDGFVVSNTFGSRRHAWSDVRALKMHDIRDHRIVVEDGSRRRSIAVSGRDADCDRLLDMAIEHVPELRAVAWGTGMSRVAEPVADAPLPRAIRPILAGIRIDGPGDHSLLFEKDHPHFAWIQAALESRLLPRIAPEPAVGAAAG